MGLTYAEQTQANVSEACHTDGIGCDGYNENPSAEGGVCTCSCHNDWAPVFTTNQDVHAYHIPRDTYEPAPQMLTTDPAYPATFRGSVTDSQGRVFVLREQYRD